MPDSITYSVLNEILWELCDEAAAVCDTSESEGMIERYEFYLDAYDIVIRRIAEYRDSHSDNYFEVG